MKVILSILIVFVNVYSLFSQVRIPELEFDNETEVVEERTNKKVYYKDGKVVLEKYYPYGSGQQNLCGRSNVVDDSIFIYHEPKLLVVKYDKTDIVYNTYEGNIKHQETYYRNNGQLRFKGSVVLNYAYNNRDYPMECGYKAFDIGLLQEYKENGDTVRYINFETGESKGRPSIWGSKLFIDLKEKAEKLVIENYGKENFNKFIKHNISKLELKYDRRKVRASGYKRNELTLPSDSCIDYIGFSYKIILDKKLQYDLIHIRLDPFGNVIREKKWGNQVVTNGFLSEGSKKTILSKEEALTKAKSVGVNTNVFNLIWKSESEDLTEGSLYYQFLENPLNKTRKISYHTYLDETLINATTGKVQLDSEYEYSIGTITKIKQFKKGDKYGFKDVIQWAVPEGEELTEEQKSSVVIQAVYDSLPQMFEYYMIAKKEDKYGYITDKEVVLIPFDANNMYYLKFKKERFNEEFLVVERDNKFMLYNYHGKPWSRVEFTSIEINEANKIVAKRKKKQVIFDPRILITEDRF